jgi:3-oxoacyl-[acyl-carrier-protein] synthase-3
MAIESKLFENLGLVGATGFAAIPLALNHAWKTGSVRPDDRVMLMALETSKWIYAGMVLDWLQVRFLRLC